MRNGAMAATALGLATALAWPIAGLAASSDLPPEVGDPIPGHPGLTSLDLLRQVIPDLAYNPATKQLEGHLKSLTHILGKEAQTDPPDPVVVGYGVEVRHIKAGGRPRLALLADLGQPDQSVASMDLLALDDEGPAPKLLDMADVGIDKDSVFAEQAVLPLGPGDAALVTWSEHDDADLTLGGYMLISPIGDRLAMVARIELTSENLCSWHGLESVHFTTTPDAGGPYRRIVATAKAVFTGTNEDGCNDEKHPNGTHVFHASWRWSPVSQRYEPARSTRGGLDALNNKLFGG